MNVTISRTRRLTMGLVTALIASFIVVGGVATSASAATGSFQGTVTAQSNGAAVVNGYVAAYNAAGAWEGSAVTGSTGFYTITGLAPGQYRVYFQASYGINLVPEYYIDSATLQGATPITVTSGGLLGSINAALDSGSTVAGTVTGGNGATYLQNAFVNLYVAGTSSPIAVIGTTVSGTYSFTGLRPGSYTLYFDAPAGYANKWWQSAASARTAAYFTVGTKVSVTNNTNLPLEGTLEGTVTAYLAGGLDATVVLYEAGGSVDDQASWVAQTTADAGTGNYHIGQLPIGTYKLGFTTHSSGTTDSGALNASNDSYTAEWYTHAFSYGAAAAINFPSVQYNLQGINMVLYNPTFADVTQHTSSVYDAIEWVHDNGISTGAPQGAGLKPLYKPTDSVSRQAMASFLFKMSGESFSAPVTPTFADVTSANPFYQAIEWMAFKGISLGTPQGGGLKPLYKPAGPVSRQSMAIFLARFAGETLVNPGYQDFADVPSSSAAFTAIHFMAAASISNGTPQPSGLALYKPLDPVSRQSMAVFLQRLDAYLTT